MIVSNGELGGYFAKFSEERKLLDKNNERKSYPIQKHPSRGAAWWWCNLPKIMTDRRTNQPADNLTSTSRGALSSMLV